VKLYPQESCGCPVQVLEFINAIVGPLQAANRLALQIGRGRAGTRERQKDADRPQRTAGRLDDSGGAHAALLLVHWSLK
jgi:hypothetical protein